MRDDVTPSLLPLVLLLVSLLAGLVIFGLRERQRGVRTTINLTAAAIKVVLVAVLIPAVVAGERPSFRMPLLPGVDLVLVADTLSLFFVALSSLLWLLTTIYAIGYLEHSPNRSRFFGFFSLCVTATVGIALAGNLVTFLIFYELLTLVTYPLIAHRGTAESLASARTYLAYTLAGGAVLLFGVAWLTAVVGPVEFLSGGSEPVARLAAESPGVAIAIFACLIVGLGVKAALVPLHGWLPKAMVAPAPVSALLHAVAVVKAGVFGIVRVIHDLYGIDEAAALGVLTPLVIVAAVTIVYGSVRALTQDGLKQRLAYSTVSQLSYVVLGAALFDRVATAGGLVHLVHQGMMKITLFFCAGLFAEVYGLSKISQLGGIGRRMPLTSVAFTVGALGMIGLPPTAGFVTKWELGLGSVGAGQEWVLAVLAASTLLNAAYFLPVIYTIWFGEPDREPQRRMASRLEAPAALLVPALITAAQIVGFGLLAGVPFSPLSLAEDIADRIYSLL